MLKHKPINLHTGGEGQRAKMMEKACEMHSKEGLIMWNNRESGKENKKMDVIQMIWGIQTQRGVTVAAFCILHPHRFFLPFFVSQ